MSSFRVDNKRGTNPACVITLPAEWGAAEAGRVRLLVDSVETSNAGEGVRSVYTHNANTTQNAKASTKMVLKSAARVRRDRCRVENQSGGVFDACFFASPPVSSLVLQ